MDINRDEIRRQLRAADAQQRASIRPWRDAVTRLLADRRIPHRAKAELLGVPGRRQFIKVGGASVLGAAVLAACGSDEEAGVGETGDPTTTTAAEAGAGVPSTPGGEGNKMNLVLVRTASSVEILAVEVYNVALGESDTELPAEIRFDPAVADAAKLFRDHHQEHADALAQATESLGGEPYERPNKFLFDNVVAKELPNLTDQAKVVMFARTLEETAAGTYSFAAGELTTPELRQSMMAIGGVEARHAAALSLSLDGTGTDAVPRSFIDASPEGRVPEEALIDE